MQNPCVIVIEYATRENLKHVAKKSRLRHHKRTHSIETESRRSAELSYRDSTKVIDKAELLIDTICKHLSTGNCDHCKKLVKESFDN